MDRAKAQRVALKLEQIDGLEALISCLESAYDKCESLELVLHWRYFPTLLQVMKAELSDLEEDIDSM